MIKKYLKIENYKVKLRSIFGKNYTVSYSQNGEDIIINTLSTFLKITKPTYIDIGAFHPKNLNNTLLFFKKGSHGINIEPNEEMYKLFQKQRRGDINLNVGVGEKMEI
ncbi:MAG: FkbM family methyltransferase, partial [Minisyncoccota bacterium]